MFFLDAAFFCLLRQNELDVFVNPTRHAVGIAGLGGALKQTGHPGVTKMAAETFYLGKK